MDAKNAIERKLVGQEGTMDAEQFNELFEQVFELVKGEATKGDKVSEVTTQHDRERAIQLWAAPGERLQVYTYYLAASDDGLGFRETYGTEKGHQIRHGQLPADSTADTIADHFFHRYSEANKHWKRHKGHEAP